ncbi:MAG: aminomethyl-transferring glycine dehydrogenase subunit GcvPA [Pelagibacterales bacterium]|nr:aminomethyl-transferring glycine dehydrogenase subunit GcvPA [Pelagibacterales bacterium]
MRYLALTEKDRKEMLESIGVSNVDQLYDAVPEEFLLKKPISNLPSHQGEIEVESFIKSLSNKNRSASEGPFFLGAGCYKHHIPASVDHIIQRSEYLTSYTPYQPEISQGTLAVIFQFQSIIALLTGMEIANASMYDGATSMAESCLMALRIKQGRKNIATIGNIHPDYLEVAKTYLDLNDANFVSQVDESCAAVIVQYPDFQGEINSLDEVRKKCDSAGALLIVVTNEIVSLGLLESPKQADIVVGEASSLGVGLNFGGPLLGFFACKKEFVRQMPGRICGATVDADGKPGYVLTLNAREQHIRREKATSNICSNQGLCATAFTIHTSLLGEIGFKKLALINHKKACDLADALSSVKGVKILNKSFFNEFTIELSKDAAEVNKKLLAKNIIGGFAQGNKMILAVSELTSENDIKTFAQELEKILN